MLIAIRTTKFEGGLKVLFGGATYGAISALCVFYDIGKVKDGQFVFVNRLIASVTKMHLNKFVPYVPAERMGGRASTYIANFHSFYGKAVL